MIKSQWETRSFHNPCGVNMLASLAGRKDEDEEEHEQHEEHEEEEKEEKDERRMRRRRGKRRRRRFRTPFVCTNFPSASPFPSNHTTFTSL